MPLTLLTVLAVVAQSAVALVTVPLGSARPAIGTGTVHARVGRVLHVHAKRKVLGQWDVAVVQHKLTSKPVRREKDCKGLYNRRQLTDTADGQNKMKERTAAIIQQIPDAYCRFTNSDIMLYLVSFHRHPICETNVWLCVAFLYKISFIS